MFKKHLSLRTEELSKTQKKINPTYVWDRVAAFIVDLIAVVLIGNLASAPVKQNIQKYVLDENEFGLLFAGISVALIYSVIFILYNTLAVYFFKQTVGKKIFGIKISSVWENQRLTFFTCFFRSLLQLFSILLLFLPFLALFYDPRRRVLHEKMSETVTVSKKFSHAPHPKEFVWVHFIYIILISQIGLFGFYKFQDISQKYSTLSEFVTQSEYLCELVTDAKENWIYSDESRLDIAIAMYHSSLVDDECLSLEAQRALMFQEELSKAYLAMGMLQSQNPELAKKYEDKICEIESNGESCLMFQMFQAFEIQNYDLAYQILNKWESEMSTAAKIIALKYYFVLKKTDKVEALVNDLWQISALKDFLSFYRTLTHFENFSIERAQEAFSLTYPDLNYDQQKVLAALACEKQIHYSCSIKNVESCEKLKENISDSEFGELTEKEFVTLLNTTNCKDGDLNEVTQILSSKIETTEQVALLAAYRAEAQGRDDRVREYLEQLISYDNYDSEITHQARLMLIERTYDSEKLKNYFAEWETMSPYHPLYLSFGMSLMAQFNQLKKSDLAYQVREFLLMNYSDSSLLKKLDLNSNSQRIPASEAGNK